MITRFDRLLEGSTMAHNGLPGMEAPQHPRQEETALQEAPRGLPKASPVVDIIIPLGPGSQCGDDELRILLRSLEANGRGMGMVWLVTTCPPKWLRTGDGLDVLSVRDAFAHNKDANLFTKLLVGIDWARTPDIVWTCDDCAVLQPLDLPTMPPIVGNRDYRSFKVPGKWHKRMRMTMKELRLWGWHYDTHTPQRWNVAAAKKAIAATPYRLSRGRCINTAVLGRIHGAEKKPEPYWDQWVVKETCENEEAGRAAKLDKVFIAYNDAGFLGTGLREKLYARFPEASKWEVR